MVASIKKIKTQGFTLVEMILYVAICSVLLFSLSAMFSYLLSSRVKSQAITEVNQQGFFMMHLITSTIRNAKSIDAPSVGTVANSLTVTTQTPITSPTFFGVSSSTFFIQESGGVTTPLTSSRISVSSVIFENISSASSTDKIVRITYTLSYRSGSTRQEYSYTKTFSGSATLRQ